MMLSVEAIDLYYGAAQALRGVSLKATVGRVTCVLGRNGVGKSSLLRAIVGHHAIAAGSIRWMDEEISGLAPHLRARRGVGFVPQGREIFPLLTVRENLMTGYAAASRDNRTIDD
jgi:urea transport system ATP-binding protein